MKKIATLLAAMALAGSANAAIFSYDFTATVYQITESAQGSYHQVDSSSLSGELISLGRVIHGRFTYDTNTAPDPFNMPSNFWDTSFYDGVPNQNTVAADVGTPRAQLASSSTNYVKVTDHMYMGGDSFSVTESGGTPNAREERDVYFSDETDAALSSSRLNADINFSAFSYATFSYSFTNADAKIGMSALAQINSLVASPVPEPTTYAMLGAGLALLAWRKKARA